VIVLGFVLQYSSVCIDHPWRCAIRPTFHWWTNTTSFPEMSETVSTEYCIPCIETIP